MKPLITALAAISLLSIAGCGTVAETSPVASPSAGLSVSSTPAGGSNVSSLVTTAYIRVFKLMDANGDGKVTLAEFESAARKGGSTSTPQELQAEFTKLTGGQAVMTQATYLSNCDIPGEVSQILQDANALVAKADQAGTAYGEMSYGDYMKSLLEFGCPATGSCDSNIKADLYTKVVGSTSFAITPSELAIVIATGMAEGYSWTVVY